MLVTGLFGISETITNLEKTVEVEILKSDLERLFSSFDDWKRSICSIIRGSFSAFALGTILGCGAMVLSLASYGVEKELRKHSEQFGTVAIEGVAGPDTANNTGTADSSVPLLVFGIPPNVVAFLLLVDLLLRGTTLGTLLMT